MKIQGIATDGKRRRTWRLAALLILPCLAAGCTTNSGPSPMAAQGFGPTVAFESVDGPPPQVFDRLVRALETESTSRNMSIVSREASASYRVRSYYAAQVTRKGSATIAWVWDVYDREQRRTLRLSGSEPAGTSGRDAWAAADDRVLQKISQAGMRGLTALVTGAPPSQESAPPVSAGPAMAAIDEPEQTSEPGLGTLAYNAQ
ncbi:MAG: hypothetical protein J0G95_11875 [Rhizobiales bacterium]|nr:hypothetical protein [Hyphomicrobiales bacterium]